MGFMFVLFSVGLLGGVLGQSLTLQDPEITMNTAQIIQRWGYPVEIHEVETADGYLIDMHRIPFGKNGPTATKRPVMFIQHGLFGDSSAWVTNLPSQSAGFIFADAGFDVWLGNVRGNNYGLKHRTLDPQMPQFWNFSFDEHSSIDLPTQVDYVLGWTGQASLNYMGHSQGSLMMFTHLSEDQKFASKIQNHFALAPIGTMNNVEGLFEFLARNFKLPLHQAFLLFGVGRFNPPATLLDSLTKQFCQTQATCEDLLFLVSGPPSGQFNMSRIPVYTAHSPSPSSTQNLIHFMQLINSGGVVPKFDFQDPQINMMKYGRPTPTWYDYTKVNAKTHLFWGDLDFLSDKVDIERFLLNSIPKSWLKTNIELKDFNHIDFVWGLKAPAEVYAPILVILANEPSLRGQLPNLGRVIRGISRQQRFLNRFAQLRPLVQQPIQPQLPPVQPSPMTIPVQQDVPQHTIVQVRPVPPRFQPTIQILTPQQPEQPMQIQQTIPKPVIQIQSPQIVNQDPLPQTYSFQFQQPTVQQEVPEKPMVLVRPLEFNYQQVQQPQEPVQQEQPQQPEFTYQQYQLPKVQVPVQQEQPQQPEFTYQQYQLPKVQVPVQQEQPQQPEFTYQQVQQQIQVPVQQDVPLPPVIVDRPIAFTYQQVQQPIQVPVQQDMPQQPMVQPPQVQPLPNPQPVIQVQPQQPASPIFFDAPMSPDTYQGYQMY